MTKLARALELWRGPTRSTPRCACPYSNGYEDWLIAARWTRRYRNAGMTSSANIRIDFSTWPCVSAPNEKLQLK
jgi:hypothetical protein